MGQVSIDRPVKDEHGKELHRTTAEGQSERVWHRDDDVVQGIVLLRKNEHSLPALRDVEAKVAKLNEPGSGTLLPGRENRALLRPHGFDEPDPRNGQRKSDARA